VEIRKELIHTYLLKEESVRKELFDRKGFLLGLTSSAAALGLAACGGAGNSLVPGKTQPNTDILCAPGDCPGGGTVIPYASTGGVNPNGYATFKQYSSTAMTSSIGYDSTQLFYHGANSSSGSLLYTGSTAITGNSSGETFQHSLSLNTGSASQSVNGTITFPATIPSQGSFTPSGTIPMSITNDASNATSTAYFTVQGVPCSLAFVQTDSTGEVFSLTYTNLNTDATTSWDLTFPVVVGTDASRRNDTLVGGPEHGDIRWA